VIDLRPCLQKSGIKVLAEVAKRAGALQVAMAKATEEKEAANRAAAELAAKVTQAKAEVAQAKAEAAQAKAEAEVEAKAEAQAEKRSQSCRGLGRFLPKTRPKPPRRVAPTS
jgi:hypothetical protein